MLGWLTQLFKKHPVVDPEWENDEWEYDGVFESEHKGLKRAVKIFGPAFIAAIAYVDPGNFATNFAGGSSHGYTLLWVVALANSIGMVVQTLSMKLGLATGKDLPTLCRENTSRRVTFALWIQAELIALATDLAEFVGAAIALNMLFGMRLIIAGVVTGIVSFVILMFNERNRRGYEVTMAAVLVLILCGFLYEITDISPDWGAAARGFIPGFDGGDSVLLACGILGATVMPHVIYLHSEVAKNRDVPRNGGRRRTLGLLRIDVVIAMTVAGVVNMLMLVVAATLFHSTSLHVSTLEGAHAGLEQLLGQTAATTFALTLLVSGLASSSVGTHAGDVIMRGFIKRSIRMGVRRILTMIPALLVLAIGLNPTRALIFSQVILSFGIPCALFPLVWLTSKSELMGGFVNRQWVKIGSYGLATAITLLDVFVFWNTFGL